MIKRNTWTPSTTGLAEHAPFCSYAVLHLISLGRQSSIPLADSHRCYYYIFWMLEYPIKITMLFCFDLKLTLLVVLLWMTSISRVAKKIGCFFFSRFNNSGCHYSMIQNLLRTGLLSFSVQKYAVSSWSFIQCLFLIWTENFKCMLANHRNRDGLQNSLYKKGTASILQLHM